MNEPKTTAKNTYIVKESGTLEFPDGN